MEREGCIMSDSIVTARKRSLGQGNIFTSVCQEFSSQEGCLVWGGSMVPGGVYSRGSAWGGAWSGGLVETPPRRLLLRAVRILLECILVFNENKISSIITEFLQC